MLDNTNSINFISKNIDVPKDSYPSSISVRIAIYDNLKSIPRIIDSIFSGPEDFINTTSQKIYSLSHDIGGKIPFTIIKETIENLIHANFKEVTINILENGNHIVISDQGPGIEDKEKAFLPGYTSATKKMKKYIRGVGSGLPIIKETITFSGGTIAISDNIRKGTVVSLKINKDKKDSQNLKNDAYLKDDPSSKKGEKPQIKPELDFKNIELSIRHIKILYLVLELEKIGPSQIAKEFGFSLSTSYRELLYLEKVKLLNSDSSGKRKLTQKGIKYLEYYSNNF